MSTEYIGIKLFDTADSESGFKDQLLEWATTREDWFLWAHYMNPHHPYEPPVESQKKLGLDPMPSSRATRLSRKMRTNPEEITANEREVIRGLYDASVRSTDSEIETLYRALKRAGELDDTLVVITADHGELLGEHGLYGHPPVLPQELLRVPLVLSGPVELGESDSQVGLIDLAPTILSLLGLSIPDDYMGQPLFDQDGRRIEKENTEPIFAETGLPEEDLVSALCGDQKVVYDVNASVWDSYRISADTFRDIDTNSNFEKLREKIRAFMTEAQDRSQSAAEIDEGDLRKDLAALGYLEE